MQLQEIQANYLRNPRLRAQYTCMPHCLNSRLVHVDENIGAPHEMRNTTMMTPTTRTTNPRQWDVDKMSNVDSDSTRNNNSKHTNHFKSSANIHNVNTEHDSKTAKICKGVMPSSAITGIRIQLKNRTFLLCVYEIRRQSSRRSKNKGNTKKM